MIKFEFEEKVNFVNIKQEKESVNKYITIYVKKLKKKIFHNIFYYYKTFERFFNGTNKL